MGGENVEEHPSTATYLRIGMEGVHCTSTLGNKTPHIAPFFPILHAIWGVQNGFF